MVELSPDDRKQLLALLETLPEMDEERSRRMLLVDAGLGAIADRIKVSGTTALAARTIVEFLCQHGHEKPDCESLASFLLVVRELVGIEGRRSCDRLLADYRLMEPLVPDCVRSQPIWELSQQIRNWFEALSYPFEKYEVWAENSFEWILKVPARRRYDRVLLKGVDGIIGIAHVRALREAVDAQKVQEGWLIAAQRISPAARQEAKQHEDLFCYTFDETIDQDANFESYLDGLAKDIQARGIDRQYVPLACTADEIDPKTQQKLGVSPYEDIDEYIDAWLEDPAKQHVSVLGEFGTGKTWFALHYAWKALQKYRKAKQEGRSRPRLPLVVPLRDYAKAVSVKSLFSEFFFDKHEIQIPNYSAFEQLNRTGKLLLIFDGFDEMAARVDRQTRIDNFWELAKVVVPGSKAILTCRTEHFPEALEGRRLLNAALQASAGRSIAEKPQFEVVELKPFDRDRIRKVLSFAARPDTVERVMGNPQLLDLARRPVMVEAIVEALPDIEAGQPIDLSRVYLYAVRRKMARDIKQERTFTSMADKLYFLCELAWEMVSSDRMTLNYKDFPDRIRQIFGVRQERDLDRWGHDMMGQTMLVRNAVGDYAPAHRSLLEFFVAYKLAAELGVLAEDFTELARDRNDIHTKVPGQDYCWSAYFTCRTEEGERQAIAPLQQFEPEDWETLQERWGKTVWTKAVLDLLVLMVRRDELALRRLQGLLQATRGKTAAEVAFFGGNVMTLLAKTHRLGLQGLDLSGAVLRGANLVGAWLQEANLTGADLEDAIVTPAFGIPLAIAYSPDGQTFATAHRDGTIRTWRSRDGHALLAVRAHEDWVNAIAYSPDGRSIASGSKDRTVKIWSASGQRSYVLAGHGDAVSAVAYSPDGQQLASGSSDKTVQIWNATNGERSHTLTGHQDGVGAIAYSPDGQSIASGSSDKTVKIWRAIDGTCWHTLEGHEDSVVAVAFHPDGKRLASASADRTAKIWNASDGKILGAIADRQNAVDDIAYSPDGRYLVSCSSDNAVQIWSASGGNLLRTIKGDRHWAIAVACSPDGKYIASSGLDGTIRIWNASGERSYALESQQYWVLSVACSPDGKYVASGSRDRTVKIWDAIDGKCLHTLEGHHDFVSAVIYSPDGQYLASGSWDGTVKIWRASDGACVRTLEGHQDRANAVAYSPDGKSIASGSSDKTVKIWDASSGKCLQTLVGHDSFVLAVAYSPDGKSIASGSADKTAKIWDAIDGECLHTLAGHQKSVGAIAYSPDGKYVASGSHDKKIGIWRAIEGTRSHTLEGHTNSVSAVAYSPDGQHIASSCYDNTIQIWNAIDGTRLRTLEGHDSFANVVAYSPDGRYVVSGSHDNTVKIWDVTTEICLATLSHGPYAGLNFTGVVGLTEGQNLSMRVLGGQKIQT